MSAAPDDVDNPLHWLARAESSLALARVESAHNRIFLEDLAFHAQQAVEKALKAVLVSRRVKVPRTHDVGELLTRLSASGVQVPPELHPAAKLTPYAVEARYPGTMVVTQEDLDASIAIASEVVNWARTVAGS
jgi:HEPN domain-containing protein